MEFCHKEIETFSRTQHISMKWTMSYIEFEQVLVLRIYVVGEGNNQAKDDANYQRPASFTHPVHMIRFEPLPDDHRKPQE
jgi:hypothetical protein